MRRERSRYLNSAGTAPLHAVADAGYRGDRPVRERHHAEARSLRAGDQELLPVRGEAVRRPVGGGCGRHLGLGSRRLAPERCGDRRAAAVVCDGGYLRLGAQAVVRECRCSLDMRSVVFEHSDRRSAGDGLVARVRVLVADDHPAMRRAIARLVSEHDALELVGEAGDGEQAVEFIQAVVPDVALVDVRMPKLDGLGVLRRLGPESESVRVVLISGYDDSAIVHEAIAEGAAGFLSKDAEESEITQAILDVAAGRSVLSPGLQSGVLDQIRQRAPAPLRLSARERELLEFAAEGIPSGEIAERLHLSPNTVKTYWQRLYEKLGASDRPSAVAEAIRRGLLK